MSNRKTKPFAFRPTVTESRLEERVVLSSVGTVAQPRVAVFVPPTRVAPAGVTPAPAPSPISARAAALELRPLTVGRLRRDYARQVHASVRDLRRVIGSQAGLLSANGATPTAQQLSNFNAGIAGALNATALRLSLQSSLLPNGGARLVPAIQNRLLGSGPRSLATRLEMLAQSGSLIRPSGAITPALTRLTGLSARQGVGLLNGYFRTTPVVRLSVNSSGQRIPLQQYIGGRLISQVGNTLGSLAQTFPNVANAMLFPSGVTGTPSVANLSAFNNAYGNAINTAAYLLGSGLSLFPHYSNVVTQLQAPFYGSTAGGVTSGLNGLVSALQNLQFGSPGYNTAVSGAFNSAFQNLVTPIARYFGMTGPTSTILPSTGFASLFGSPFTGSTFFNGFNNGFATGTTPGFIGFGLAPTGFNTAFGTGFNNIVTNFNGNLGFNTAGIGSGINGIGSGVGVTGGIGSGVGVTGGIGSGVGVTGGIGSGVGVTGGIGSGMITGTGSGII